MRNPILEQASVADLLRPRTCKQEEAVPTAALPAVVRGASRPRLTESEPASKLCPRSSTEQTSSCHRPGRSRERHAKAAARRWQGDAVGTRRVFNAMPRGDDHGLSRSHGWLAAPGPPRSWSSARSPSPERVCGAWPANLVTPNQPLAHCIHLCAFISKPTSGSCAWPDRHQLNTRAAMAPKGKADGRTHYPSIDSNSGVSHVVQSFHRRCPACS